MTDEHDLDVENMGSQEPLSRKVHKLLLKRPNPRAVYSGSEDSGYDESHYFELDEGENWLRLSTTEARHSILDDTQESPQETSWFASILSLSSVGEAMEVSTRCYLCLDVDGNSMAIKDMRPPNADEDPSVGIARRGNPWELLTRRQLRILHPGDRICTVFQHDSPGGLVLEYQYSLFPSKQESQRTSLDLLTQPMDDDDDNDDDTQSEPKPASNVQILETQDYDSDTTMEMTQSQMPIAGQPSLGLSTQPIQENNDTEMKSVNLESDDKKESPTSSGVGQKEITRALSSPILKHQEATFAEEEAKENIIKTNIPVQTKPTGDTNSCKDSEDLVYSLTPKSKEELEHHQSIISPIKEIIHIQEPDDSEHDPDALSKVVDHTACSSPSLNTNPNAMSSNAKELSDDNTDFITMDRLSSKDDKNSLANDEIKNKVAKNIHHKPPTPNLIRGDCNTRDESIRLNEDALTMKDESNPEDTSLVHKKLDSPTPSKPLQTQDVTTNSIFGSEKAESNASNPRACGEESTGQSQDISMSMLRETGEESPSPLEGLNAMTNKDDDSEITEVDGNVATTNHVQQIKYFRDRNKPSRNDDDSELTEVDAVPGIPKIGDVSFHLSKGRENATHLSGTDDDTDITEVDGEHMVGETKEHPPDGVMTCDDKTQKTEKCESSVEGEGNELDAPTTCRLDDEATEQDHKEINRVKHNGDSKTSDLAVTTIEQKGSFAVPSLDCDAHCHVDTTKDSGESETANKDKNLVKEMEIENGEEKGALYDAASHKTRDGDLHKLIESNDESSAGSAVTAEWPKIRDPNSGDEGTTSCTNIEKRHVNEKAVSQEKRAKKRNQEKTYSADYVEPKRNKRNVRAEAHQRALESMTDDRIRVEETHRKRRRLSALDRERTDEGMTASLQNREDAAQEAISVLEDTQGPASDEQQNTDAESTSQPRKKRTMKRLDTLHNFSSPPASTTTPSNQSSISRSTRKRARETPPTFRIDDNATIRVMATNVEIDNRGKRFIQQIGGIFIEKIEDAAHATHVIAACNEVKLKRTPKFMVALSRTSNIVHLDWLIESAKAGRALDTNDYLLLDQIEAEKQFNFKMSEALLRGDRLREQGTLLLNGVDVFLCAGVAGNNRIGNKTPPMSEFRLILEGAGAKVLTNPPSALDSATKTIIITSKDPKEQKKQLSKKAVATAVKNGAIPKTTEEIFHAIMTQEFAL